MRGRFGRLLTVLLFLFAAIAAPARADSWVPPETATYASVNGQYRLIVIPRKIGSQLAYFEAKVRGETLPEPEGPLGRFERLQEGQWVAVWSRRLVNEVAPVKAMVSDDGRHVVTFDNWHMTGHGEHVVVLYGEGGKLVRSLSLDQIVPAYFIDALPASVSSIQWRGDDSRFVPGDVIELAVSEPRAENDGAEGSFPVRVALADGQVEPVAPAVIARLGGRVCDLHRYQVRLFNDYLAYEHDDLVYPDSGNKNGWQRYLHHAIERLKPRSNDVTGPGDSADPFAGWMSEEPFELLDDGEYMEKDTRDMFREALAVSAHEMPRRWFAARDQAKMVREVERTAKKIKPGQLAGVEMRFFADNAHWPQIRGALGASGAQLIQIDIAKPIAQRPEALADLPPLRSVDPACAAVTKPTGS